MSWSVADKSFYNRQLGFRTRRLSRAEHVIGPISGKIEESIATRSTRVLEVGYGFGSTLVDLRMRFGSSVELYGLSNAGSWGSWDTITRASRDIKQATEAELAAMLPPTLIHSSADEALPFDSHSFDFVFSQVAFYLFKQKAQFLEEVSRVLRPSGVAMIEVRPLRDPDLPEEWASLFSIEDCGTQIDPWEYLISTDGIVPYSTNTSVHILGGTKLKLGLSLVEATDLSTINPAWGGYRTCYRLIDPPRYSSRLRRLT